MLQEALQKQQQQSARCWRQRLRSDSRPHAGSAEGPRHHSPAPRRPHAALAPSTETAAAHAVTADRQALDIIALRCRLQQGLPNLRLGSYDKQTDQRFPLPYWPVPEHQYSGRHKSGATRLSQLPKSLQGGLA